MYPSVDKDDEELGREVENLEVQFLDNCMEDAYAAARAAHYRMEDFNPAVRASDYAAARASDYRMEDAKAAARAANYQLEDDSRNNNLTGPNSRSRSPSRSPSRSRLPQSTRSRSYLNMNGMKQQYSQRSSSFSYAPKCYPGKQSARGDQPERLRKENSFYDDEDQHASKIPIYGSKSKWNSPKSDESFRSVSSRTPLKNSSRMQTYITTPSVSKTGQNGQGSRYGSKIPRAGGSKCSTPGQLTRETSKVQEAFIKCYDNLLPVENNNNLAHAAGNNGVVSSSQGAWSGSRIPSRSALSKNASAAGTPKRRMSREVSFDVTMEVNRSMSRQDFMQSVDNLVVAMKHRGVDEAHKMVEMDKTIDQQQSSQYNPTRDDYINHNLGGGAVYDYSNQQGGAATYDKFEVAANKSAEQWKETVSGTYEHGPAAPENKPGEHGPYYDYDSTEVNGNLHSQCPSTHPIVATSPSVRSIPLVGRVRSTTLLGTILSECDMRTRRNTVTNLILAGTLILLFVGLVRHTSTSSPHY